MDGWINDVANDLPEHEARILHALQPPLPAGTFADTVTAAAWRGRPSWYVVSTGDRVVNVDLERHFAARMEATTIEVAAGHLSPLSQPDAVARVILEAVAAISLV